ncbi:MAG: Ribosomal protein S12 methylthiotransferase RimO [Gammaproteobacteria bacterium]|nr:Ribosomal protein S12 methylthiotransferase RimO [Gammaproteobacteria bacterium]
MSRRKTPAAAVSPATAGDRAASHAAPPRVGFVSLGCPKALVDSERILTQLKVEGYDIVPTYDAADIVVVNTCGFIDSAVEESLEAIGEAMAENGRVIVTGCLGAREQVIRQKHPHVLAVTGPQRYEEVVGAVHRHLPPQHDPYLDLVPPQGVKLTPRHYAYLKISEGCNHRCTFCIIPSMRGDLVSRPVDEVMREAERLVAAGVKELLVISQDTSAYGADLRYAARPWRNRQCATSLSGLCGALGELGAWVRLHYVYPYAHVDEIIPLMAERRILPYLDIPLQHGSASVLRRMKRPAAAEGTLMRIERWREICPDLTIRSTFIVGFPGETEREFDELLAFIAAARLDRVGCFAYSPVDGAAANRLEGAVPEEVKEERRGRFMEAQATISRTRLADKVGRSLQVLVDEVRADGSGIARSSADAPEIDGVVIIEPHAALRAGQFATVRVTASSDHDLMGVLGEQGRAGGTVAIVR